MIKSGSITKLTEKKAYDQVIIITLLPINFILLMA